MAKEDLPDIVGVDWSEFPDDYEFGEYVPGVTTVMGIPLSLIKLQQSDDWDVINNHEWTSLVALAIRDFMVANRKFRVKFGRPGRGGVGGQYPKPTA